VVLAKSIRRVIVVCLLCVDMVDFINISDSDSAEEAARRTAEKLKEVAKEQFDQDGELEVSVREDSDQWVVSWPAGPFGWTMTLTGGRGLAQSYPSVSGFGRQENFVGEVKNEDELVFTPD